jgi:hypothetical protein
MWDRRPSKNAVGTSCDCRDPPPPQQQQQKKPTKTRSAIALNVVALQSARGERTCNVADGDSTAIECSSHGDTKAFALRPHESFKANVAFPVRPY